MMTSSAPMGASDHGDCQSGQCQPCADGFAPSGSQGSEEGKANRKAWNNDFKSYGGVPTARPKTPTPKR